MSGPWDQQKADAAVVGNAMATVIAAAKLRRVGLKVATYLSGSDKAQRKRAIADASVTLTVLQAEELAA